VTSRLRQLDPHRLTKPIRERLDTQGMALPKPAQNKAQQPKDGRLIQTSKQYSFTKRQIWIHQNYKCANCPQVLASPAFGHRHHVNGRGHGGGKRDDRQTVLLCIPCHEKEHPGPQWTRKIA
jgi:5-methylcytosine-specific restriction endonuclease McrA